MEKIEGSSGDDGDRGAGVVDGERSLEGAVMGREEWDEFVHFKFTS